MVGGFAPASDAIRWTAVEDSLWSFSTLELNLSKLSDSGVPVCCERKTGWSDARGGHQRCVNNQTDKGQIIFLFFFNGD